MADTAENKTTAAKKGAEKKKKMGAKTWGIIGVTIIVLAMGGGIYYLREQNKDLAKKLAAKPKGGSGKMTGDDPRDTDQQTDEDPGDLQEEDPTNTPK